VCAFTPDNFSKSLMEYLPMPELKKLKVEVVSNI